VVAVEGSYDQANRLSMQAVEAFGWGFVNVNLRPYYSEGSKTLAFETIEQLGWKLPDRVVAPIASGSMFTKVAKGMSDWLELGLVEGELPTFCGAQALGCSPVAQAFAAGTPVCRPVKPDTIAKSLAIGNPADGPYAVELAQKTGGGIDSVTDDEICEAIVLLLERTKLVVEGAGAVGVAALLSGKAGGEGPAVALLSGGNIDPTVLISVMRHGLTTAGRYLVVRSRVQDRPGELLKLLKLVAQERGNVVSVEHHREGMDVPVYESEIELTLQMRDEHHCAVLLETLRSLGYTVERLR
jgi:threonine synthase